MHQAVLARVQAEHASADPRRELGDYLSAPLDISCKDILKWWQDHEVQFPTLAHIACDYLAIPGLSVPSERSFSSMRHIGTDFRNCLSPSMFKAVQILKSGYKAGTISAMGEVMAQEAMLDVGQECLASESSTVS
jgi:hypothetical protein